MNIDKTMKPFKLNHELEISVLYSSEIDFGKQINCQ